MCTRTNSFHCTSFSLSYLTLPHFVSLYLSSPQFTSLHPTLLHFTPLYLSSPYFISFNLSLPYIISLFISSKMKLKKNLMVTESVLGLLINPLNPELNPICYLLALLGAHHFLHISRIRVKSLTLRLLMSYIYIYIWSTHS